MRYRDIGKVDRGTITMMGVFHTGTGYIGLIRACKPYWMPLAVPVQESDIFDACQKRWNEEEKKNELELSSVQEAVQICWATACNTQ